MSPSITLSVFFAVLSLAQTETQTQTHPRLLETFDTIIQSAAQSFPNAADRFAYLRNVNQSIDSLDKSGLGSQWRSDFAASIRESGVLGGGAELDGILAAWGHSLNNQKPSTVAVSGTTSMVHYDQDSGSGSFSASSVDFAKGPNGDESTEKQHIEGVVLDESESESTKKKIVIVTRGNPFIKVTPADTPDASGLGKSILDGIIGAADEIRFSYELLRMAQHAAEPFADDYPLSEQVRKFRCDYEGVAIPLLQFMAEQSVSSAYRKLIRSIDPMSRTFHKIIRKYEELEEAFREVDSDIERQDFVRSLHEPLQGIIFNIREQGFENHPAAEELMTALRTLYYVNGVAAKRELMEVDQRLRCNNAGSFFAAVEPLYEEHFVDTLDPFLKALDTIWNMLVSLRSLQESVAPLVDDLPVTSAIAGLTIRRADFRSNIETLYDVKVAILKVLRVAVMEVVATAVSTVDATTIDFEGTEPFWMKTELLQFKRTVQYRAAIRFPDIGQTVEELQSAIDYFQQASERAAMRGNLKLKG